MKTPRLAAEPEWNQYIRLGEQLLRLPNAAAQCTFIIETIQRRIPSRAEVWLAQPFYPLPGEPALATLPDDNAPSLVQRAMNNQRWCCMNADKQEHSAYCEPGCPLAVAIPMITQDNLLGVLYVYRTTFEAEPFNSQDLNFLNGLASHIALILQSSRQMVLKNWRFDQLALVRSVSAKISNLTNIDDLCSSVSRLIQEAFNFYFVAIYTLDEESDKLLPRGSCGQDRSMCLPDKLTIKAGDGIIGYAARSHSEHYAPDVNFDPLFNFVSSMSETRSEVAIPLLVDERVLGVLDVQSDYLNAFHEIDILMLRALADNISMAVQSVYLYQDLQHRTEHISTVYEVSHAIASILDRDELLAEVVRLIQDRFKYPFVHIFTIHSGRKKIIYQVGGGERSEEMGQRELSYDLHDPLGMIPWVARNGSILLANDVRLEPRYRPSELAPSNTRSELAIPLIFGEEVLGVLDIQSDQLNGFNENDQPLLKSMADSIAIAIRNANLYHSEKWRHQVADSFQEVAQLVSDNTPLNLLLDAILAELHRNLPCDASAIWLLAQPVKVDELDVNALALAATRDVNLEALRVTLEASNSAQECINRAMRSTEPTIRHPDDPSGPLGLALNLPADYSSIASPLRSGNKVLGLIALAHHMPSRYGSEARAISATFANYASMAIENARLFGEAQDQAWVSTVLLQVADTIQETSSVDELLTTIIHLVPMLVGINKCAAYLWEEALQAFTLKVWHGLEVNETPPLYGAGNAPALLKLASSLEAAFITDPMTELGLGSEVVWESGTLVLLPLQAHGHLLGALLVAYQPSTPGSGRKPFQQQTFTLLMGIVHQTSIALENLRFMETRQEEAYVTAVLLQVTQAAVSQDELKDILDTIVHLMPILVGIDACAIYLWDEHQAHFNPAQVYAGSDDATLSFLSSTHPSGQFPLLDQSYQNQMTYFCGLGQEPPQQWANNMVVAADPSSPGIIAEGAHRLVAVPLATHTGQYGVMLAKERGTSPAFQLRRLEILNGIAQQISMAIQNDFSRRELLDRERLDREMQLARQIQQAFLPSHLPEIAGWEVDSRWETARSVGGDFYDIFKLPDGRWGLVIADVSDKGMPAALYMTVTRALIRSSLQISTSPAEVLQRVNDLLQLDSTDGMFVTAVFAVLDPASGEVRYANAGHNLPLLLCAQSGKVQPLPKGGLVLGVMPSIRYQEYRLTLSPGDSLVLYTDGVTDNMAPDGQFYGEERLQILLEKHVGHHAEEMLCALDEAMSNFRQGLSLADDITVLTVRRLRKRGRPRKDPANGIKPV
jgi:sigma-B regulation protein RsbU (phosphoserine phosphatase)